MKDYPFPVHEHTWHCQGGVYGCHLEGKYPQEKCYPWYWEHRAPRYGLRLSVALTLTAVLIVTLFVLA